MQKKVIRGKTSNVLPDLRGSSFLLGLPDDIFSTITRFISPRDVCNLGFCCRDLNVVMASDKVWLAQCDKLGLVPCRNLVEWRKGVCSYKAICRFLINIQPLLGIWVHQNPELGNVVYVMPGFLSVIGCRIIPQEVGPLGLENGSVLWAPVFEILCNYEGSPAFFLHGKEKGEESVYPGLLQSVDRTCNVLLLEVDPRDRRDGGKLAYSKNFACHVDNRVSKSEGGISKSQRIVAQNGKPLPFSRLGFGDRRRLLDIVTGQVRLSVAHTLLFPWPGNDEIDLQRDVVILLERQTFLLQMYKQGGALDSLPSELGSYKATGTHIKNETLVHGNESTSGSVALPTTHMHLAHCNKDKTLSGFLKKGFKHILGKSSSTNVTKEIPKKTSSNYESKHIQLHEFLQSGETIGLSLRATTMKLSSYKAWPNMHDNRVALYKLPMRAPKTNHEFAGLWGGTFGWPPGKTSEEKPGKALFFILITYEESEGQKVLIGTKILEGTSYVLHPNGSAMFIVNTANPSMDPFPWDIDGNSNPVYIKKSYMGEGIANGYGFRYPGSKPGSLFIIQNGLVFVWKESRDVLTLQRLELSELLRNGKRVPSLSPVSNFAYLTKTYSNVFSGFSNS